MKKPILWCFCLLILSSCATYKPNVSKSHDNWDQISFPPSDEKIYSVFLIGDAGYSPDNVTAPPLTALQKQLVKAEKKSAVIFLGDNIYPKGMPEKEDPSRKLAEHYINAQLDILKDYKGKAYFIPGNHDWYADGGNKGIERQEDYIEEYLDRGNVYLPDNACSGPVVKEVNDELSIIFVDSKWWMEDWSQNPGINAKCETNTREGFLLQMADVLKKNRRKMVLLALHHPVYTYGPHGGHQTTKSHIFPLTYAFDNLYIPLPIFGTAINLLRNAVGTPEDITQPKYKELRQQLLTMTDGMPNVVFASGHEHNLQHIYRNKKHFIISGSGSKKNPAALGSGALFKAGEMGFARMDYYKGGRAFISYYTVNEDGIETLAFQTQVSDGLPEAFDPEEAKYDEADLEQKNILSSVNTKDMSRTGFFEMMWGKHYRDLYDDKITVPVLDITQVKGGLKPIKRGGGMATNSLRLENPEGQQYVLRSMRKDASRLLPHGVQETIAADLVSDQFTMAHPYSAFTIAPMASAVGIYHTEPELYYVPKQKALGEFNSGFGNEMYLFEARPAGDRSDLDRFGNSSDIISSIEVIDNIRDKHKYDIDHNWVLRSRLFDILIADWDRHDDQWRWASFEDEESNKVIYRPIPRDRDQPFSTFDGLMPFFVRNTAPIVRWQVFGHEIKNAEYISHNARFFDRDFLTECNQEDWAREIRTIQRQLTDEIIENAIKRLPENIYAKGGAEIAAKLKSRRDDLLRAGLEFYRFLSKNVDVVGTNEDDLFEITRIDDDETKVVVYELTKKGKKKRVKYDRTFFKNETDEIRLYGLRGTDQFNVTGSAGKGIKIRMVGGTGKDVFKEQSNVTSGGKKSFVYDYIEGNTLQLGKEGVDRTSKKPGLNSYDRRAFKFDYNLIFPSIGGNPDDGLYLGVSFTRFIHKFKKAPQVHQITARYAFDSGASDFSYSGYFPFEESKWGFGLDAVYEGPTYVFNYFGFGNQSPLINEEEDFNRVKLTRFGVMPSLKNQFSKTGSFSIGPIIESVEIEDTEDRFISESFVDPSVFERNIYTGLAAIFDFQNVNKPKAPSSGVHYILKAGYRMNITNEDNNHFFLSNDFRFYIPIIGPNRIVLASRIGGYNTYGDIRFFEGASLGASENLRGYRNERFTGEHSFYHNTDLRIGLFRVKSYYFPFAVGVFGGFDYGKVWADGLKEGDWHTGYGGGIWISPFGAGVISAGLFKGDDEQRIDIRFGFLF